MTTMVGATPAVVKIGVADMRRRQMHPCFVETLASRLRWILRERGWTARELARRAGLKEPHVSSMMQRLETNARADVELKTVVKIARAAGVTIEWLATGVGPVESTRAGPLDPYPGRQHAARAARELGLSEEAILSVQAETVPDGEQKRARWWFDRMVAKHTLVSAEENPTPDPSTPAKLSGWRPTERAAPTRRSTKS